MITLYRLTFLIMILTFFQNCSSEPSTIADANQLNAQPVNIDIQPKIEKIAPQPLIYREEANIAILEEGYGTFGTYAVETKEIANTRFDYNPSYKNLALKTRLYYPKDDLTPNPTLFFYSGYGIYDPDYYKALFYFVASKGYNIIFLTCPKDEIGDLSNVTRDAIAAFSYHIDRSKVGFLGHSMGAGASFWQINEHPTLGNNGRLLFPMASGYTVFNTEYIPLQKELSLPSNTKMIQQVYAKDFTTDVRIGFDLFLNSSIPTVNKEFMFLYGDTIHSSDHGACMSKATYHYDAFMQRTIFRPLDALMDEVFNNNPQARATLKEELKNDPYFQPYIDVTPQLDIASEHIRAIEFYPYNCYDANGWVSKRKEYCSVFGL